MKNGWNRKIKYNTLICLALVFGIACAAWCDEMGVADANVSEGDTLETDDVVNGLSLDGEELKDILYQGTEEPTTGTYSIPDGWETKSRVDAGFGEVCILRESSRSGEDTASEITCSYQSMLYSSLEYEQLRDLLTNEVLYQNMNASISTTCLYTDNQDNLFQITADDASLPYRDIYFYVTGFEKYFCVKVREYRDEASENSADGRMTPEGAGKQIAVRFSW